MDIQVICIVPVTFKTWLFHLWESTIHCAEIIPREKTSWSSWWTRNKI